MANKFNEYFIRHPRNINTSIPQSNTDYLNLISNNDATIRFYYTTPEEIESVIKNVSNKDIAKIIHQNSSNYVVVFFQISFGFSLICVWMAGQNLLYGSVK